MALLSRHYAFTHAVPALDAVRREAARATGLDLHLRLYGRPGEPPAGRPHLRELGELSLGTDSSAWVELEVHDHHVVAHAPVPRRKAAPPTLLTIVDAVARGLTALGGRPYEP
jgi:hypothetical protein